MMIRTISIKNHGDEKENTIKRILSKDAIIRIQERQKEVLLSLLRKKEAKEQ